MSLRALYDRIFSEDYATWIGHGLLGFLIGLVLGPGAVFAAFLYRELSDLLEWKFDERPEWQFDTPPGSSAFKRRFGPKLKDGFFDLGAPMLGAILAEFVKILL